MLFKGGPHQPRDYNTNVINPYTRLMVWQWRLFLVASTQGECGNESSVPNHVKQKIIVYREGQIALNRKWSRKFEKWCKFSSCVKAKSAKRNRVKRELPVLHCICTGLPMWMISCHLILYQLCRRSFLLLCYTGVTSLIF
jgi:hypothetical protein